MYQIVKFYRENNYKINEFKMQSRFLWNDHIGYTRNAIISILSNLMDVDAVSQRLMKNQEDIGDFISPYYSATEVNGYVDLLKEHITIAIDVIKGLEGAEARWRINGNDIVNYMYNMNNTFWPTSVVGPLWTTHMDKTIAQVQARNSLLWGNDITAYDENHQCMSEFADLFSTGVIYQNIDMFCFYHDWGTKNG